MNNVNGVIVGIDIQDKITQAAIWDEQTEMVHQNVHRAEKRD